jgi:EAL and modified HD-GYP domain-containing signal transduction protein
MCERGKQRIPELALLARQPIYDTSLKVVAYELLYRSHADALGAQIDDPVRSSSRVIVDACLEFGLDQLVGTVPAHINFPPEMLRSHIPLPADPKRVVIEVLEDVQADPDILETLTTLREHGHLIALDDFTFEGSDTRLLSFAHLVKLDLRELTPRGLERTVAQLRALKVKLVAEKVESLEELRRCADLGFTAFQGYFLRRPEILTRHRIPTGQLEMLRIVSELNREDSDLAALERAIARDPATSYRIMRCIGASSLHFLHPVTSLRQAIAALGVDELRRLCAFVALAGLANRPTQLIVDTLMRARMCEILAESLGMTETGACFLAGMLSLLDVVLGQPIEDIVIALPLAPPVQEALTERRGEIGRILCWVERYEAGEWDGLEDSGAPRELLCRAYLEALHWADAGAERSLAH